MPLEILVFLFLGFQVSRTNRLPGIVVVQSFFSSGATHVLRESEFSLLSKKLGEVISFVMFLIHFVFVQYRYLVLYCSLVVHCLMTSAMISVYSCY